MNRTVSERLAAQDSKSVVRSVIKALDILACFSAKNVSWSVSELAELTGLNKATCNRLVNTIALAGWLQRTDDGRFQPTVRGLGLGAAIHSRLDIRDEAHPVLAELVDKFGDTGYLMVPLDGSVVCVDIIEGSHPVKVDLIDIGTTVPLYVGAGPLAIMAHRSDLLAAALAGERPTLTKKTVTSKDGIRRRIKKVRAHGYSISDGDYLEGVTAIGAPVFDHENQVSGALSIGGVEARFTEPRRSEIVAALLEAANCVSARLGASQGNEED